MPLTLTLTDEDNLVLDQWETTDELSLGIFQSLMNGGELAKVTEEIIRKAVDERVAQMMVDEEKSNQA